MTSPDAQDRLAYLDASVLVNLIENDWDIFDGSLLPRPVWEGRIAELLNVRNRIGHCRRPHADDLLRLEQILRDLEPGLLGAVRAFNRQEVPSNRLDDDVVRGWVRGQHEDASRLLRHAEDQYEVRFQLRYSSRPWAETRSDSDPVTSRAGYVWHAAWTILGWPLDLERLWTDDYFDSIRDQLLFVCADFPHRVEISFPAVQDGEAVADSIGTAFDAILMSLWRGADDDSFRDHWKQKASGLDPRVQVVTPWSLVDDSTSPIKIF